MITQNVHEIKQNITNRTLLTKQSMRFLYHAIYEYNLYIKYTFYLQFCQLHLFLFFAKLIVAPPFGSPTYLTLYLLRYVV